MHALFIDRASRCWELWLSECTDRDCDYVVLTFKYIVNRRGASGTEVKRNCFPGIPDACERRRRPLNLSALPRRSGLDTKYASRPTLACQAVADGNADWIFGD